MHMEVRLFLPVFCEFSDSRSSGSALVKGVAKTELPHLWEDFAKLAGAYLEPEAVWASGIPIQWHECIFVLKVKICFSTH